MRPLYDKPIRGLKPTVGDLRAIAHFNRIIKNYLKMKLILQKSKKTARP